MPDNEKLNWSSAVIPFDSLAGYLDECSRKSWTVFSVFAIANTHACVVANKKSEIKVAPVTPKGRK